MKIYIAGPMTGIAELNFPAFHAAAAHLRSLGHTVINPAELNPDPAADWLACMRVDIAALVTCDAVALLVGYSASRGAMIEFGLAEDLGLPTGSINLFFRAVDGFPA